MPLFCYWRVQSNINMSHITGWLSENVGMFIYYTTYLIETTIEWTQVPHFKRS